MKHWKRDFKRWVKRKMLLRNKLFYWLKCKVYEVSEAQIIPVTLRIIYYILFPIKSMFTRIESKEGYQLRNNTWLINGVHFTGELMMALAQGNKHLIKITNKGGVIHFDEKSERKVLLDYLNYLEKEGGNKFTNSEDMVDIYLKIKK